MSSFILGVKNQHVEDRSLNNNRLVISGYCAAIKRLDTGIWPIFKRTRNQQKLKINDKCLIYTSGTGEYSQCIIGEFMINRISEYVPGSPIDAPNISSDLPSLILKISEYSLFEPKSMRNLALNLNLTKNNPSKFGLFLQGGIIRLPDNDYNYIKNNITVYPK